MSQPPTTADDSTDPITATAASDNPLVSPPTAAAAVPATSSTFPTLIPALSFRFKIGPPSLVGSLARGQPLTVVPIVSGTVRSEESFGVVVDAEVRGQQGCDYVRNDPDGKRMRLDCGVVVEDVDGNMIHVHYTGVVDITPGLSAILGGSPGSKTTEFGHSFIHVTFESGCDRYKELETGVYVGAGRFVVDERGLSAEYKVSRVAKGQGTPDASSSS